MSSVTKRITEIKQPRGGYIKPSQFKIQKIEDGQILSEHENVHASVCAGHGTNSVGVKPTTGIYRQV